LSQPLDINKEYSRISELFFAVWNTSPPINYIWVDFENEKVVGGHHDSVCDLAGERRNLRNQGGRFVELISYDEKGNAIRNFDNYTFEEDVPFVKANRADLLRFLAVLQQIDILSWRNSFPSQREGISWRVDIYSSNGSEKHSSGQARFPLNWAEFGRAIGELLQSAQQACQ
jgi:hypothetical protein